MIFSQAGGEVTQPRTNKQMKVHLLLKGDVDIPADQDRRVVFAQWLTAPENPFFAKSVSNRIWGHLLGRGIVDPIDDFRDSNPLRMLACWTSCLVSLRRIISARNG